MTTSSCGCVSLLANQGEHTRGGFPTSVPGAGQQDHKSCILYTQAHALATLLLWYDHQMLAHPLLLQRAVSQRCLGYTASRLCHCALQQVRQPWVGKVELGGNGWAGLGGWGLAAAGFAFTSALPWLVAKVKITSLPSDLPLLPSLSALHSDEERLQAHKDMNDHVLPGAYNERLQCAVWLGLAKWLQRALSPVLLPLAPPS